MSSNQQWPVKFAASGVLLLSLLLTGCGSEDAPDYARAAVSGTVTFNGTPLKAGTIRFVPSIETPGPKISIPVKEGTFSIDQEAGPAVGEHRIEIQSSDTAGLGMNDEESLQELRQSGKRSVNVTRVPSRYNTRSQLTKNVLANEPNEFTFTLSGR